MNEITSDELLSAGTPADSAAIQLWEMIAVVSAAGAIGLTIATAFGFALLTLAVALFSAGAAWSLRHECVLLNEQQARDARTTRYRFPPGREDTINNIEAPEDLKKAALTLVGYPGMTRFEIADRLSARVGPQRATEYLKVILQHADEEGDVGAGHAS